MYEGVFREDMFDEAEGLDHPYFATKHESEKIARTEDAHAMARVSPRAGRRRQQHRRDGQDRRSVLLLQADPEDARAAAAMDADGGAGRRAHQHRAGRFRRRCDRPYCAQEGPRRPGIPSGRSDAVPRRRRSEHLCARRARAEVFAARQCGVARIRAEQRQERLARADAGSPHSKCGDERPGSSRRHHHLRQLSDAFRCARQRRRR